MTQDALPPVPIPADEDARLAALDRYQIMDTEHDPAFDRITEMASRIFGVPIVLVTLLDEERQWFKASCGLDKTETPRSHAFCSYTIHQQSTLVIEDARLDPRTAANPLVTGPPFIRFYAGAPLMTDDGFALGSLCLIDPNPRSITDDDLAVLEDLADLVIDEIELRLALEEARRTEGERVELIATVAHEVRNPLTAALGLAEILVEESSADSETLALIRDSIRDADHIIEDLLVVSRIDRGSFDVVTREVSIRPEVDTLLQSFDREFLDRVVVSISAEVAAEADPLRLRQILRNLLSNAERYGGDSVSIDVISDESSVRIQVVDDGDGVDDETAAHLFQTFTRGHAGLRHASSSGLGLAVSRRLARAMSGELDYERRDGRTTFTLTLQCP